MATELALQEVLFRAQDLCLPLERRDSLGGQLVMQYQLDVLGTFEIIGVPFHVMQDLTKAGKIRTSVILVYILQFWRFV